MVVLDLTRATTLVPPMRGWCSRVAFLGVQTSSPILLVQMANVACAALSAIVAWRAERRGNQVLRHAETVEGSEMVEMDMLVGGGTPLAAEYEVAEFMARVILAMAEEVREPVKLGAGFALRLSMPTIEKLLKSAWICLSWCVVSEESALRVDWRDAALMDDTQFILSGTCGAACEDAWVAAICACVCGAKGGPLTRISVYNIHQVDRFNVCAARVFAECASLVALTLNAGGSSLNPTLITLGYCPRIAALQDLTLRDVVFENLEHALSILMTRYTGLRKLALVDAQLSPSRAVLVQLAQFVAAHPVLQDFSFRASPLALATSSSSSSPMALLTRDECARLVAKNKALIRIDMTGLEAASVHLPEKDPLLKVFLINKLTV